MPMHRSNLWSGILTAGVVMAALAAAPVQASALRVQIPFDIRSTNPGVNRDHATDGVVLHMIEGLVAYGEDSLPKPLLAERVDVSPDGLTYSFMLRQGVKDGRIVTVSRDELDLAPGPKRIKRGEATYAYKRQHCLRCGSEIQLLDIQNRTSYHCPTCQPR